MTPILDAASSRIHHMGAPGSGHTAGPSCLGAFHLAAALGYGDRISNRVVDALGDLSGGIRLQAGGEEQQ